MPSVGHLIAEAVVVGIAFLVLFFAIHVPAMAVWKEDAMMSHKLLALQVFVAAVIGHLIFEATGANAGFCAGRDASSNKSKDAQDDQSRTKLKKPYSDGAASTEASGSSSLNTSSTATLL